MTSLIRLSLLAAALGLTACAPDPATSPTAHQTASRQTPSQSIELQDLHGRTFRPLQEDVARAKVLIFLGAECPISDAYAPEIKRLSAEYAMRNIKFYAVYDDGDLPESEVRAHAEAFGFECPVLLDPRHILAHAVGAVATPEAVLIGANGSMLYRGRIDDQFAALGKQRPATTRHDLRAALDEFLAGRPITVSRTRTVGCAIEYGG